MNKTELIRQTALIGGLTQAQAANALEAMMVCIADTLAHGGSVRIGGFGTFGPSERGERRGRNPKTGEAITIPAAKTVKFKAAKDLKKAVQG